MTLLTIIVVFSSCIQLFFWLVQLDGLYRSKDATSLDLADGPPSVTLVIAIKNEVTNLKKNISQWLDQDYPALDVIIVNDHSRDDSLTFLKNISNDRLLIVDLPEGKTSKKSALTQGIALSKSEWIVTTDADCQPESKGWISTLMNQAKGADVILGYSPHRYSNTWIGRWIDYETWYIAIQYLSASLKGRPYMSVGRNVAFKKAQFDQVGGYASHMHVRSGDDDLLVNELGQKVGYNISLAKDSWVWTEGKSTWGEYFQQKRRHLSTASHYNFWNQVWLMAVYMSQLLWYVSVSAFMIWEPWFGILVLLRWLMLVLVAHRSKNKLDLNIPVLFVPLYDVAICLFYGVMSFTMLQKKRDW